MKEAVESVSSVLAPVSPRPAPSALIQQRDACARARELASLSPQAGRLLVPYLVPVFEAEVSQQGRDSGFEMFVKGVSPTIQTDIASTIATVAGHDLLSRYSTNDVPQTLLKSLEQGAFNATTLKARQACITALGRICAADPDQTVSELRVTELVNNITEVLESTEDVDCVREGVRLLTAFNIHCSPATDIPKIETIEGFAVDDPQCLAYVGVLEAWERTNDAPPDLASTVYTSEGVSELLRGIAPDSDTYDSDTSQALGESYSILPTDKSVKYGDLMNEVRWSTGWDHEALCEALGIIVSSPTIEAESFASMFAYEIEAETGPDRWHASRVLGEVIANSSVRFDEPYQQLVEITRLKTGRERRIPARALGFLGALELTTSSVAIDSFIERVHGSSRQQRRIAARTLGEVAMAVPEVSESVPESLLAHSRTSTDWSHWMAAQTIGEIVAAHNSEDPTQFPTLIEEVKNSTGSDRRLSARVLGAVVHATGKTVGSTQVSLGTAIDETDPPEIWDITRALGEVIAASATSDKSPIESLVSEIESATLREQLWLAEVLGVVVQHTSEYRIEGTSRLVAELSDATDRRYRILAQALGLAVAERIEPHIDAQSILRKHVKNAESLNRWRGTRLFGEYLAVSTETCDETVAHFQRQLSSVRGTERAWPARMLGEYMTVAQVGSPTAYQPLLDRIQSSSGPEQRLAAQTLGETVVSTTPPTVELPSDLLSKVRTSGLDEQRWIAAWALGLVVACGSPERIIDRLVASSEKQLTTVSGSSDVIGEILQSDVVDTESLIASIQSDSEESHDEARETDLSLELSGPIGHHILGALSEKLSSDTVSSSLRPIQDQIQRQLASESALTAETRILAVQLLLKFAR